MDFRAVSDLQNLKIALRHHSALGISSSPGRDNVLSGKYASTSLSSCPGTHTVFARKPCRPAWGLTSSSPGKHIVLSRKAYRPTEENLSSSPGIIWYFFLQIRKFSLERRASVLYLFVLNV